MALLQEAKSLAQRYRALTGKPLGITGEVAELEAARILGLELCPARNAGHDAVEIRDGIPVFLQIKGRCLPTRCKSGQRLGSISLEQAWDAVLMVLLDENFEAVAIFEAPRVEIVRALELPGSRARNERNSLGISQFKRISKLRWSRATAGGAQAETT